jgi:hypothetical protein
MILLLIGIILFQVHKVYNEKALICSVFLCIDNGEVEQMGSIFGYNEYKVKRGAFYFFIQEFNIENFTSIKIYQNDELLFEKSSLDVIGLDCRKIAQRINDKLKVA